jgi:urease accessory protein UreE
VATSVGALFTCKYQLKEAKTKITAATYPIVFGYNERQLNYIISVRNTDNNLRQVLPHRTCYYHNDVLLTRDKCRHWIVEDQAHDIYTHKQSSSTSDFTPAGGPTRWCTHINLM